MRLSILDANSSAQTILVAAPESVADQSGIGTGASAPLMAANALRAGWFIQNLGTQAIYVNELGGTATSTPGSNNGSIMVPANGTFPPVGYPITTTAINVFAPLSSPYVAREW